jgi:hypothetical protein
MKLKTIFEIQSILDNKAVPCDMLEFLEVEYYSSSKETFLKYGDMHITHFIRALEKKLIDQEEIITRLSKKNSNLKTKIINQIMKGVEDVNRI